MGRAPGFTQKVVVSGKTHIAPTLMPDYMFVTFPSGVTTSVVFKGWKQLARWIEFKRNFTWADFDH